MDRLRDMVPTTRGSVVLDRAHSTKTTGAPITPNKEFVGLTSTDFSSFIMWQILKTRRLLRWHGPLGAVRGPGLSLLIPTVPTLKHRDYKEHRGD